MSKLVASSCWTGVLVGRICPLRRLHPFTRPFARTTSSATATPFPPPPLSPSIQALHDRVRSLPNKRTVVLAEGGDPRVQRAAVLAVEQELCNILLLDESGEARGNVPPHIPVLNPRDHPRFHELTEDYCFRRGLKKNDQLQNARDSATYEADMRDASSCLYFGNLLVKHTSECDGSVAGAVNSSGATVSSAIKTLGLEKSVSTLSSFFIMAFPRDSPMKGKTKIFSDCAVVASPTSEQLAEIAIHAARNGEKFLLDELPRVAMLSFSTKGSSTAPEAKHVSAALEIVRRNEQENGVHDRGYIYDGELQLDAAIMPHVAASKAPDSPLFGTANVLVFPNLGAGNIGYKMAERMAGAVAVGPILQGLSHPANDLSRGCTTEDILDVIAVTILQSVE